MTHNSSITPRIAKRLALYRSTATHYHASRRHGGGKLRQQWNFSNTLDWNRWMLWEEAKPFA